MLSKVLVMKKNVQHGLNRIEVPQQWQSEQYRTPRQGTQGAGKIAVRKKVSFAEVIHREGKETSEAQGRKLPPTNTNQGCACKVGNEEPRAACGMDARRNPPVEDTVEQAKGQQEGDELGLDRNKPRWR